LGVPLGVALELADGVALAAARKLVGVAEADAEDEAVAEALGLADPDGVADVDALLLGVGHTTGAVHVTEPVVEGSPGSITSLSFRSIHSVSLVTPGTDPLKLKL
jgi:hypothetical protein